MRKGICWFSAVFLLCLAMLAPLYGAGTPVTVSEEKITIPTYLIGPPDPDPQFYFGGASQ